MDIRNVIENLITKKGGSIRKVAKAIGLDHVHLSRIVKPGSNPELATLEKILSHFGYTLSVKRIEKSKSKATPKKRRVQE
jgi:DNA-binding phage protein